MENIGIKISEFRNACRGLDSQMLVALWNGLLEQKFFTSQMPVMGLIDSVKSMTKFM